MLVSNQVAQHLEKAERSLGAGDYAAVHQHCMAVLAEQPQTAHCYYLLAQIPAAHDNPSKALDVVERALRFAPEDPRYLAFAAQQLLALNQQQQAQDRARSALAAKPTDAHTLDTIGVVFSRTGDHAAALPCFEAAVTAMPSNASYQYNLGSSSQFLGDFEQARAAYEAAIEQEPLHYRAHSALSQLAAATESANHIERLQQAFSALKDDADAALHLGHALAKEFEDLGDYPAAFAWLGRGKAGKRAALRHSTDDDRALFAAAHRSLADAKWSFGAVDETAPIFVVGMPRTGTTLVDRTLSSHSAVTSVGELTQFALLLKRAAQTHSAFVLDAPTLEAAPGLDLHTVGGAYQAYAGQLAGSVTRTVDKMPLNFFYVPLILAAIPNARVIALRRHPMDACLSNYRQLFATSFSYYRYAYDLEQTAQYYANYAELMDAFAAQLPSERFAQVRYEDLVADFEAQAQRLLAFCELAWEDQCLQFHKNTAPVATASSVQVREPLYQRASGRWRRYGEALAPLAAALKRLGVEVE